MSDRLSKSARRALRHVHLTPGITRHELALALGVSVTTINPLVASLLDARAISEVIPTKEERTGAGRPRAGLTPNSRLEAFVALVWGHGVIDAAVMSFDGQIHWRRRISADAVLSDAEIVDIARETLTAGSSIDGVRAPSIIVLALPAPYEPGGVASTGSDAIDEDPAFGAWHRDLLSREFAIPVIVENDANLGALGESKAGAAMGTSTAIYVKLSGLGVGSGLTVNGGRFSGSHGFAGEIAHVRVDDESQIICACGSRGCLEEKIGPNMLRQLHANYGSDITYDDLLQMIERSVPGPTRLLQDAGRVAGRALADMCTFFNPGVLVLDAGSPSASDVLIAGVLEQIEQSTPPFVRRGLRVAASVLGDDASLVGALHFAREHMLAQL